MRYPGIRLVLSIGFLWLGVARCQTNTNWPSVVTVDAGATVDLPGPAGYQTKDRFFTGGTAYTDASMGAGALSTLRYGTRFSYAVPVASGHYLVRFFLVEPNATAPLRRLFKILVNGQESDVLDVFGSVGARPAGLMVETTAISYFGKIKIDFVSVVGNAIVNQIEVLPAFTGPSTLQNVTQSYECIRGMAFAGQHLLGIVSVGQPSGIQIQPHQMTLTEAGAIAALGQQATSSCLGIRAARFSRPDGTQTEPYILISIPPTPHLEVLDLNNPLYWKVAAIP